MLRTCSLAALTMAMAVSISPAQNILDNGDFEAGKLPWKLFSDARYSDFYVDNGVAKIRIGDRGTNSQLYQAPLPLDGSRKYELSFYASLAHHPSPDQYIQREVIAEGTRTDGLVGVTDKTYEGPGDVTLKVAISQHVDPFANYGLLRTVNLTHDMQKFVFRFTTTPGDKTDARLRFAFENRRRHTDYEIDNVVLRPLDCGDGVVDDGEECDDGNNAVGDGCDGTCAIECQINFAEVDYAGAILHLAGGALCADPRVLIGTSTGELVELPVLDNGVTFIDADLSSIAPLTPATHQVTVACPGDVKKIDVAFN